MSRKPKHREERRTPHQEIQERPPVPNKAAAPLQAKTDKQRQLLSHLRRNTLTLVTGPAGVGKTYVALAHAADLLKSQQIDRIILTRPLVGVDGEESKIGALPGTLGEKLQFWAMPMVDVLIERMGKGYFEYCLAHDRIRIVPLAYLRGSSFNRCYIHCTEAQNTTPAQIKMLLTRVGEDTCVVLDGDLAQSDLKKTSGLEDAMQRLEGVPNVGSLTFTKADVVRSSFCQDVLERYAA